MPYVWYAFKQEPRDVDIFLSLGVCNLACLKSQGNEISKIFVNFIKVLGSFS